MKLVLEKRERVTTGDKDRGEIRSEIGMVTETAANVIMDNLGKGYRAFEGWVEVLLVVSGLDVNRNVKAKLVNTYVSIKEGNMGGDGLGESGRITTIEVLKGKEKGIMGHKKNQ